MSMCVTHPGRHGDLLWALATVRAIQQANPDHAVDLAISAKYGGLKPLLEQQPYLRQVDVLDDWRVEEAAPIAPRKPPRRARGYARVVHLGYKGWPRQSLAHEVYQTVQEEHPDLPLAPLALATPWLTAPTWTQTLPAVDLSVGFTDEWFELKYGLWWLLRNQYSSGHEVANVSSSPRWTTEGSHGPTSWEAAAGWISHSRLFVGCCSALHVLAVGVGVPVVCMEPAPARQQPVFYPVGMDGPQVTLVRGNDGQPTFDARHLLDEISGRITTPSPV